jgi:hypothetical protein
MAASACLRISSSRPYCPENTATPILYVQPCATARRLKLELKWVSAERDFIKKTAAYFAKGSRSEIILPLSVLIIK